MKINTKYVKALYLLDMNRKDKIEKKEKEKVEFMKKIMKKYLTGSKALIVLWAVISMIIIAPS